MARQYRSARQIDLGTRVLPYTFVRTVGRRRFHIVVDSVGAVELRVPYHGSISQAESWLRENRAWVLDAVAQAEAVRPDPLHWGMWLPYWGRYLRLEYRPAARVGVRGCGDVLEVRSPSRDDPRAIPALERWYRRQARAIFDQRIDIWAPMFAGRRPSRLQVRAQRTRWGSCTSTGVISLNWRLLLASARALDYVVAHELCHLTHLDHSRAFWALLSDGMPDWRARRDELGQAYQPAWDPGSTVIEARVLPHASRFEQLYLPFSSR